MIAEYLPEGLRWTHCPERIVGRLLLSAYDRFEWEDRAMLICRDAGTTLFLDRFSAEALECGNISSVLQYKLVALGFARVGYSPAFQSNADLIRPTFFLIDLTNVCNLECRYCLRVPENKGRFMSDERLLAICRFILQYCRRHDLRRIVIQPWGGEPLLHMEQILKIRHFFDNYPELWVRITVETNGILLSEEAAHRLKAGRIELSVSVDGPPDLHDLHRCAPGGRASSVAVLQGIRNAQAAGYNDLGSICVLTDHSIGRVEDILNYAEDVLGLKGVKLNPMHQPAYDCKGVRAPNQQEIVAVSREIVEAVGRLRARGSTLHEACTADRLGNLLKRSEANICHSCGCCGGKRMVSFDMDGNIYPCELTDWSDECLGNVDDGRDLIDMVREAYGHPYFRSKSKDACDQCPWWYYCRGGCTSAVKYLRPQIEGVDETECAMNLTLYPLLTQLLLQDQEEMKKWLR